MMSDQKPPLGRGMIGSGSTQCRGESSKGKGLVIYKSDAENSSDSDDDKTGSALLSSVAELEKALPMKRGLSKHYDGKLKPFNNLSDLSIDNMSELGKEEDALNKKRRLVQSHDYLFDVPMFKNQPMTEFSMEMLYSLSFYAFNDKGQVEEEKTDDQRVGERMMKSINKNKENPKST